MIFDRGCGKYAAGYVYLKSCSWSEMLLYTYVLVGRKTEEFGSSYRDE